MSHPSKPADDINLPIECCLRLAYCTSWRNPIVHYTTRVRWRNALRTQPWQLCDGGRWRDLIMQSAAHLGRPEWQYTHIPLDIPPREEAATSPISDTLDVEAELVFASSCRSMWDKPPPGSATENYLLTASVPEDRILKIDAPKITTSQSTESNTDSSQLVSPFTPRDPSGAAFEAAVSSTRICDPCDKLNSHGGPVCASFTVVDGLATQVKGKRVFLVTDLDGTLLGHDEYLRAFSLYWRRNHAWRGSILVYSTGRNLKDMLTVAYDCDLLRPDFAVCGVGTELYTFPSTDNAGNQQSPGKVPKWMKRSSGSFILPEEYDADILDEGARWPQWCKARHEAAFDNDWLGKMRDEFDRNSIAESLTQAFPSFHVNGTRFHDPWRLSVSAPAVDLGVAGEQNPTSRKSTHPLTAISSMFGDCKVLVSGAGEWRYLDILPQSGGKLAPILCLTQKVGRGLEEVLVCGDSGNDIDMFAHPLLRGCCVSNAQPDLVSFLKLQSSGSGELSVASIRGLKPTPNVCFAPEPCAGGILHAIKHFGFS
eukprot:Selendium_serpulae@DN5318_c0_g2_i1.p1